MTKPDEITPDELEHQIAIESLLDERRHFPPPAAFAARANVNDPAIYQRAADDYEAFWEDAARGLDWYEPWHTVLDWQLPFAKWFVGGKLNVSYNCLDRHVNAGRGDRVAYYWEGEPGDRRVITYADLLAETERTANALKELGVGRGDRVAIYMPMVPELPAAMLACTRIGAAHTVVFGGFSSESLADRINDSEAKLVITADGGYRRGKPFALKQNVDAAVESTPSVEHVLVLRRTGQDVAWKDGRDVWWHDIVPRQEANCEPERMDSEDMLYLLYTSGTTAKPKGILHTTGGYLTHVSATHRMVFDLRDDDVYWCAADIGWVTGHSYIVYGPLLNGATSVMYEGAPDYPTRDRWWEIAARYGATILYTAPTAIRTFMKWGDDLPAAHDLSKLRLLGSVGEPINPEAWLWYRHHIGGDRCPIVDTWWQTETGGIMISPLPAITATKPGSATLPLPGIEAKILDGEGHEIEGQGLGGNLVITKPWPGMARTLYREPERFIETYWSRFGQETYAVGDAAFRDGDGYFWIVGRLDDVINVSGHRLSTMEVEAAVDSHPSVAEAAVIGVPDEQTGQAIVAFVTPRDGTSDGVEPEAMTAEIREHVAERIGKLARPARVYYSEDLPKTRSGKIMRRLLRDIATGHDLGDTTTLRDPSVVESLAAQVEAADS